MQKKTIKIIASSVLFLLLYLTIVPLLKRAILTFNGITTRFDLIFAPSSSEYFFIFFFLAAFLLLKDKLIERHHFKIKNFLIFFTLGILLFGAYFYFESDFNNVLSNGVGIEKNPSQYELLWNEGMFFGKSLFAEKFVYHQQPLLSGVDSLNESLEKRIYLNEVPPNPKIAFLTCWQELWSDSDVYKDGSRLTVSVNGNKVDLTESVSKIRYNDCDPALVEQEIDPGFLQVGRNVLEFSTKSTSNNKRFFFLLQPNYLHNGTSTSNVDYTLSNTEEALIWISGDVSPFSKFLYRLGILFKILGTLSLFVAVFGFKLCKSLIKESKKPIILSLVISYLFILLTQLLNNFWPYLSKAVAYSTYYLYNVLGYAIRIDPNTAGGPLLIIADKPLLIALPCSGIDGITLFTALYLATRLAEWKTFNKKRMLPLYLAGVTGMFALNIVRIVILTALSVYSSQTTLALFHSNLGYIIFIAYFLVYNVWVDKWARN